jgi:hypothetical protein
MSDKSNRLSRRRALRIIAAGTGAASTLPLLENNSLAQHRHAGASPIRTIGTSNRNARPLHFFNAQEMTTIATIAELIIPTDQHSPGAKDAEVPAFIDLIVSVSPKDNQALWRDGLAALDGVSRQRFSKSFPESTAAQQVELLTEISKGERNPKTIEERFFSAIKHLTVDGYYTSRIGIHQDLEYKGNSYVKEFKGCTHPEHLG